MACANASNIKIRSINAFWEMEETICVDVDGIVAADLGNTYFNIYDASTTYYVWFNLDAGGVDPAPGGTGIEVAVSTGASETTIRDAIQTAVAGATGYNGRREDTRIFFVLDTTETVASDAADVDSGIDVGVLHKGGSVDLGLLDGDVSPEFGEDLLDVTAHQTGTSVLAQLRQGNNASVSLTLKESTDGLYKEVFGAGGDQFTPSGGTLLYGWGDSKQGGNTLKNSRRLRLHPYINAANDNSEDLTFWLAYPNPDSIVFSGENFNTLSVSFTTFLDLNKPSAIRRFAFGDYNQSGVEAPEVL